MRGREGVPLPLRELFIMGLLAVLDTLNQFYFHGRDGLTVGVSSAEVRRSLESVDEIHGTRSRGAGIGVLEPRQESLLVGRAVVGKRGGKCLLIG